MRELCTSGAILFETVAYSQAENYPQSLLNGISATN
jgi:hypothetical protein